MARLTSSWKAKMSSIVPSKASDQSVRPLAASISEAEIRILSPMRRTLPDTTYPAPTSAAEARRSISRAVFQPVASGPITGNQRQ